MHLNVDQTVGAHGVYKVHERVSCMQSPLLREASLVVEADVLGPSDEMPQSRGNDSFRAQVMPQQPHSYQQSHVPSARNNTGTPTSMLQR